jgi:hypothetical protein
MADILPRSVSSRRRVNMDSIPELLTEDGDAFGGLIVKPEDIRFATQDSDEDIFILTRRDAITNLGWIFRLAFLIIIPIILLAVVYNYRIELFRYITPSAFSILLSLYVSGIFTYGLIKFSEWYYNIFIITNKRIIEYTFTPLSKVRTSEAELIHIQDVSESVVGILPVFFDYGDLLIQTAAQHTRFTIESVPRVTWLRNILVDLGRAIAEP